jgi:hypothetical protein
VNSDGRAGLDDLAVLHHGDPVAVLRGEAEIVGDQDGAHPAFADQVAPPDPSPPSGW